MVTALPLSNTEARIQPANSSHDTKGHTVIYQAPHPLLNLVPVLDFRQFVEAPRLAREIIKNNPEDALLIAYYVAVRVFGYHEALHTIKSLKKSISELKAAIVQLLPELRWVEYIEHAESYPYFPYSGQIKDVAASFGLLEAQLVAWMRKNGWLQTMQFCGNWLWRPSTFAVEEGLLRDKCFGDEGLAYVTLKGALQLFVQEPRSQENGELVDTNPFDVDVCLPFWWRRHLPETWTEESELTLNLEGLSPRATISVVNNSNNIIRMLTELVEERIQLENKLATMIPKIEAFRAYSG